MLTGTQVARVDEYLAALERALHEVEPDERDEVMLGVREHIDAAFADRSEPADDEVDAVLRQLGAPESIAAAATRAAPVPRGPRPALARDWVPVVVLLLITFGSVFFFLALPVLLWLAGLVLLWASPLWRVSEKLSGTLVPAAAMVAVIALTTGTGGSQSCSASSTNPEPVCTGSGPSGVVVALTWVALAVAVLGTIATLTVLWRRGARRAR